MGFQKPLSADRGVLTKAWSAKMISPSCDQGEGTRASFVTRRFSLETTENLVLRVSAQGVYVAYLNGKRIGNDILTPGWTCYDDRIAFQVYDVSSLAKSGENVLEIQIGDGWFRSPMMWFMIANTWGDKIGAIAELYQGERLVLETDAEWKSGLLPVTRSGIYYGEDYDARLETLEASSGVEVLDFNTKLLVPHETAPVREIEPIASVKDWVDGTGAHIFDFGQNVAGYVAFEVEGEAGAEIYIDNAEVLSPEGEFDNRNYRKARSALKYTLKGEGVEAYRPRFSFMGYRYARVQITGKAKLKSIVSVPITSVPNITGGFECAVPEVNRLVLNTIWSQRGNFIEVPTDCPQRDERLGWTGDAQVFAGTACWLADCETFLRKYLRDVMADTRENGAVPHFSPDPTRIKPEGNQFPGEMAGSTGWGDVITVMPWQLYLHYGDDAVLRETFPAMVKWLDYLWGLSNGPIIRPSPVWGGPVFTFGDWLQPKGPSEKPRPTISDDCAATLYHFISTDLAAKIAGIIGEEAEAKRLAARAEEIKAAFKAEYFSASGRLAHNDQTSYALAFLYGLVPPEHHDAARGFFKASLVNAQFRIGTGFIGTPALLPALTKLGLHDEAEKLFLNRDVPGWLYQVGKGATTIWERWDAIAPDGSIFDPHMNSYNHYAYGAVCQWLFESVAGIAPTVEGAGFEIVDLDPVILPELSPVSMWHDSVKGRFASEWELSGNLVTWTVTLPEGARGRLRANANYSDYRIDGQQIDVPPSGYHVPEGQHVITFQKVA